MGWKIVGGPREFRTTTVGDEPATGWAWDIEEHGVQRVINAEITAAGEELYGFEDAEGAVRDVLSEVDPPARLVLTGTGIERG
jgi:hypothetical protein